MTPAINTFRPDDVCCCCGQQVAWIFQWKCWPNPCRHDDKWNTRVPCDPYCWTWAEWYGGSGGSGGSFILLVAFAGLSSYINNALLGSIPVHQLVVGGVFNIRQIPHEPFFKNFFFCERRSSCTAATDRYDALQLMVPSHGPWLTFYIVFDGHSFISIPHRRPWILFDSPRGGVQVCLFIYFLYKCGLLLIRKYIAQQQVTAAAEK